MFTTNKYDTSPDKCPVSPKSTTSHSHIDEITYDNKTCKFCDNMTTNYFVTCSLDCLKANTTSKERTKLRVEMLKAKRKRKRKRKKKQTNKIKKNKDESKDESKDEGIKINISSDTHEYLKYNKINKHYKKKPVKKLHYVKSITSHDGYDRHGPKAYCHEIMIVYMRNSEYIVDTWCAEYRFLEDQSLELYNTKIYSKQKFNEYYNTKLKKKDYENDEFMDFSPPVYDLTNLGGGNYKH